MRVWVQVWGLSGKWSMVMWCSAFGPVLLVLLVALAVRAPNPAQPLPEASFAEGLHSLMRCWSQAFAVGVKAPPERARIVYGSE